MLLLAVAVTIPCCSIAQANQNGLKNDMVLKYLVKEPVARSEHPPVIILLHGYGSNEADLFSLGHELPKDALIIAARAPISLTENGFAWYHIDFSKRAPSGNVTETENSRMLIVEFIAQVVKQYHADPSRVYLMGFSQGAIMSYSLAITYPAKIKGILVLSGRLLDEVKPKINNNDRLRRVSIFIGHGTADNVLQIQYARDAHTLLSQAKVSSDYHEYTMAHEISNAEIKDIKDWFAKELKTR